ncbi:MAG: DNA topoisomerase 3 [Pseudomonadota bacterium]
MTIAIVAEKPAVARDIAKVLGANKRGDGYLYGNDYAVTWAIGHLVGLAEPHEINPAWKRWRREDLPILPDNWPLVENTSVKDQFHKVKRILNDKRVDEVICATDAGREGELIFRYIYEASACNKPIKRLWISSLTPDAIRAGFNKLQDGKDFDGLADAARGRSRADWLVGMNLSRACTLAFDETFSVGRVQTPTLAMLVERELAIRNFVPKTYHEVEATFEPQTDEANKSSYTGTWFFGDKPSNDAKRLPADGEGAQQIVERAKQGDAVIESIRTETRRMAPPLLYDLTELQRHANRLFGFKAQRTLEIAQKLYEQHKLITYPRTDSRHLSKDVASTLPKIVDAIKGPYQNLLALDTGKKALSKRFVDDKKITDHHAIIPTPVSPGSVVISQEEKQIYDLICRRLLMAWHQDHVWEVTTVITTITSTIDNYTVVDRYHSTGKIIRQAGWKMLDIAPARNKDDDEPELPTSLAEQQAQTVLDAQAVQKQTRPPKRMNDATLLTAMETAGRAVDDEEASEAMKESGLGTPATRADIIETLVRRGYLERQKKNLIPTDKGIRLINVVQPELKNPIMTGQWEARLGKIHQGDAPFQNFMQDIEGYVREAVQNTFKTQAPPPAANHAPTPPGQTSAGPGPATPAAPQHQPRTPTAPDDLKTLLKSALGFEDFRPYQEAVCRAVTEGTDALLVMPTGAGKSLCYQLPGLARAGTTLVISPLIALMEDQVGKLQQQGLCAERIHSGRDRMTSRAVCQQYLNGTLDYLFIAPERLSVPGFPEMLAKRKPVLVAVDEAHCISHWGHDFRPDYRMLGQHLPKLHPAPIIALTATATPLVQDDILKQLNIGQDGRFIHGFRRDNIAVEIANMPPSARHEIVRQALSDKSRRPAIVYAPTRKETEQLGSMLKEHFPAAAYHGGMMPGQREQVQQGFIRGELEVIVATLAFGMGVDKADIRTVIHTGLPSSLESYYQEIGRAGRDGKPSRAILLYSWADRRMHEFFHERDYPTPTLLEDIHSILNDTPQNKDELKLALHQQKKLEDEDQFDVALEKLWIHGGAQVTPEEYVWRGESNWQPNYAAQRDHKSAQLEQMTRFADAGDCRMLYMIRHFGDLEDAGKPCGMCDICVPKESLVARFRATNDFEQKIMADMLRSLRDSDDQSAGRLFENVLNGYKLERRDFEQLLNALNRAGLVNVNETSFQKDGKDIQYRRVSLTRDGQKVDNKALADIELSDAPTGSKRQSKRKKKAAVDANATPPPEHILEAVKEWRLNEARKRGVPAFRIFGNRVLNALASAQPKNEDELLDVPGIGPAMLKNYGQDLLKLFAQNR